MKNWESDISRKLLRTVGYGFAADGTHENRRWTFEGVLERLKSIRKSRATMAGVEFDHIDTADAEQSEILRHLGVRLPTK